MAYQATNEGGGVAAPSGLEAFINWLKGPAKAVGWTIVSVGLFALLWEFLWLVGLADPKLLPPPHVFMGNITEQAQYFNTAQRWQIGADPECRSDAI